MTATRPCWHPNAYHPPLTGAWTLRDDQGGYYASVVRMEGAYIPNAPGLPHLKLQFQSLDDAFAWCDQRLGLEPAT